MVKIIRGDIYDYFAYLSWVQDNSYSSIFIHMNPYSREGERRGQTSTFLCLNIGEAKDFAEPPDRILLTHHWPDHVTWTLLAAKAAGKQLPQLKDTSFQVERAHLSAQNSG